MDDSTAQLIIGVLFGAFVILLLCLPGAIATKRNHRNATAIWISGFLIWPVGLIWSLTGNVKGGSEEKMKVLQAEVNAAKIASLEKQLADLKGNKLTAAGGD
jgi:hypothetical protein